MEGSEIMAMDVEQSLEPLAVDVAPGRLTSNLDEFTARCREIAEEYSGLAPIADEDEYRQAKRNRAAINKRLKDANAARISVKTKFMEPYDEFNAEVTEALAPLQEAATLQASYIKDYERRALDAKKRRLEEYWETTYPKLALCTGEAEEPLVPFRRIYDPDWCKRVSEATRDEKPIKEMDAIATKLSDGRDLILDMQEPEDVKADAMSRMYRTLDPMRAIGDAREEARRRADIDRLDESIDGRSVSKIAAPEPLQQERSAKPAGRYVIEIVCETFEEKERVVEVMKSSGIHGTIRRL